MTYAPIALFVYKRPEHTRRTLNALIACEGFEQSQLFVYCDGPRAKKDEVAVIATRQVLREYQLPNMTLIERGTNKGLANSIIDGVGDLCARYGRVIVVEDDLIVAPVFLKFLNAALNQFENDERVMQISAFNFFTKKFEERRDAFFLPLTTSWGWATWRRAWVQFDPDARGWEVLKSDTRLRKEFNLNGSYDFYSMLMAQEKGEVDSWAIRWYWTVFKLSGLVLYPPISMVNNIGVDGSGTHGQGRVKDILPRDSCFPDKLPVLPSKIVKCNVGIKLISGVFFAQRWAGRMQMLNRLRDFFMGKL